MAKYTHNTPKYKNSNRRSGTPARAKTRISARDRVAADSTTAERTFGSAFPAFGASLGVSYDGTNISKTHRNPSVA